MAYIAQDTFSTVLKDGGELLVAKGSAWPDNHEVVKLDAGRGLLFKPVEESFGESPVKAAAVPKAVVPEGRGGRKSM
jgi:hypothetical protein